MRSKHGFRHVSQIEKEASALLAETWEEYATKKEPSPKDRAKNVCFHVPSVGKVMISLANGRVTFDTDLDENEVKKVMKKHLGPDSYKMFCMKLKTPEVGAHFRRFHGTVGFTLRVTQMGEIPIWISSRGCRGYNDIHIKVPSSMASMDTLHKGMLSPTPTPLRKYLTESAILDFVRSRGSVTTKDARYIGLSETAFYRRLENLVRNGHLVKTPGKPSLYALPPPR
ncbi:MAG: hypothetical protein HY364_01595 [Candidatus Aenigmarchaeota archaeon]|nr:hypothetical protein [Candidatus Aenigmarchaeota archaeon]